jgi:hypothetical protein
VKYRESDKLVGSVIYNAQNRSVNFTLIFTNIISSKISSRVSRSGKITFNTCFAVYRIHFWRARSPIYNPYIYQVKTADPSVLFNYTSLFFLGIFHKSSFGSESSFIQSRPQYIGYIYTLFQTPRLACPIYSYNISACDHHEDCFE